MCQSSPEIITIIKRNNDIKIQIFTLCTYRIDFIIDDLFARYILLSLANLFETETTKPSKQSQDGVGARGAYCAPENHRIASCHFFRTAEKENTAVNYFMIISYHSGGIFAPSHIPHTIAKSSPTPCVVFVYMHIYS